MGNKEALPRGCVQYLSAGTGITHSVGACWQMACIASSLEVPTKLWQHKARHTCVHDTGHDTCHMHDNNVFLPEHFQPSYMGVQQIAVRIMT